MALAEKEMTDVQYKSLPFESLQNLSKAAPTRDAREKAEWYMALVYLRNEKHKEAKAILKRIANEPRHLYQRQAKGLLIKM